MRFIIQSRKVRFKFLKIGNFPLPSLSVGTALTDLPDPARSPTALPFLKNTRVFLYPLTLLALSFVAVTASGVNLSRLLMEFHTQRVLLHAG